MREPVVAGDDGLVRAIGVVGLAAGIVNITVGGGIFRLPSVLAGSLGAAAPLAYLLCVVLFGLIVLCIADAGSRVSLTGGPYAYVETALGPFVGFLAGVLLWLLGTFAMAAVSTVFAGSVGALVPAVSSRVGGAVFLLLVFGVHAVVNIRGVAHGTGFNNFMTIAKLLPLLLLVVGGIWFVRPENLVWASMPAPPDVARAALLLVFAFAGVETALVPSGEVRDPARTVPKAVGLGLAVIAGLYVALQVVAQGVLGNALATETTAPLAAAAGKALGSWARTMLLAGAAVSMFGYVGGMMLAVPRALYAFARDGMLPRALARVHEQYRTPWVAIVTQGVVTFALAASSTFERLAVLSTVSVLLLYAACAVSAWLLRRRGVSLGGTPLRLPAAPAIPWLALAVIGWMLKEVHTREWLAVGACLAVAALVFAVRGGTLRGRAGTLVSR